MSNDLKTTSIWRRIRGVGAVVGPGLVTAAVVLGPGSITVSSKCGALMGYSVLWTVLAAAVMMVVYTVMGARIGMVAPESLLTTVAGRYGRWLAVLLGLSAFLITTGFQTGNNLGVGLALTELVGGSVGLWAAVFTAVALAFMWFARSLYRLLERMMVLLVAVMIVAFVGNLLMIRPDVGGLARGFVPSKPAIFGLVVAISATTFSVAAAAFQAYLVRAKGWKEPDLRRGTRDSVTGICALAGISMVIMITAATVLQPAGITITSAVDMARQLEPLLGPLAKWLFLIGLWAGAFSSFIINAMIGGVMMADGLGIGEHLESRWAKILGTAVMLLGTVVALAFGRNPIQLLVMAQGTTIIAVPLIAIVMSMLANDRALMGKHRNSVGMNVVAAVALGWLLFLSFNQVRILAEKYRESVGKQQAVVQVQ
ncbi:MAG: Nramp family divalent metal transporter [Lentisphaerae bacterium]|jgi:manganese transport protein|nr:Nramp family divalent metal transporter [Lentisphaerota bacterium]MBT4820192.1 Nramp family divalent metal transporter [Lentisphaerota bacterium]MBT5609794.1 Nramp family divalent metal transporter [Lentisphaerota bacterium]MBT7054041.1 Nramp family divalent metal transporter [Lentisphaerota bacterium]MBT7846949.1 Nramp family divalent metal transporter [Lentisphaerota bacterium]